MEWKTEYAVVQEFDMQSLQDKVNRLAQDGYAMAVAYGIPSHVANSHVVWMVRSRPVGDGALRSLATVPVSDESK